MVLEIQERLGIMGLLGQEGSLAFLKAKRDIVSKVGLSADELEEFEIVEKDGKVGWNPEKAKTKEIEFTGGEVTVIVNALKELEKEEKLQEHQLSLYEKFVEGG